MDDAAENSGPQPIGAYLATQRRVRGISIEDLSAQTRIPLRSLERLESGSFDTDVDGFVRGFVRTVADALGLDPDETLNRTLEEPGLRGRVGVGPQLSLPRVLVAVAVFLLIGALGFGVQLVAISLVDEAPEDSIPGISLRRDPIRALAEAQGVRALAPPPARAKPAVPTENEESVAERPVAGEPAFAAPDVP